LFSLLGTTYGGNGTTTFALPDLRNRIVVGTGNGVIIGSQLGADFTTVTAAELPTPPAATTADMISRHGADGLYEIYDLGNNAILAAYSWAKSEPIGDLPASAAGFFGNDTTDMLLRSASMGRLRGLRLQQQ